MVLGARNETASLASGPVLVDALPPTPNAVNDLAGWLQLQPSATKEPGYPALLSSAEPGPPIYSVTGERLPSLDEALMFRARLAANAGEGLGRLASKVTVSDHGCWVRDLYRNSEGYLQVPNPRAYGLEPSNGWDNQHGITLHRLSYILLALEAPGKALGADEADIAYVAEHRKLPPGKTVDHICRNTACGCPGHMRLVSDGENNRLKWQAQAMECAIFSAQLMMVEAVRLGWVEESVTEAIAAEPVARVLTRGGPFNLLEVEGDPAAVFADRQPDPIFDALPAPAPDRRLFKSRAKCARVAAGQLALFKSGIYRQPARVQPPRQAVIYH